MVAEIDALARLELHYTSRDSETILADLLALVQQTRPDLASDFLETNLGRMLLELHAAVGDMLSAGQDVVANEAFLVTARRYASGLNAAKSVGYRPISASASEVLVQSVSLPQSVIASGATVPAGSYLTGANGFRYELLEDVRINPGDTVSLLTLYEGQSYEETYDPTNQPGQVVTVENSVVAEGSWSVFVGDVNDPDNEWLPVDFIDLELGATQTFQVSLDPDGRLIVKFGDGEAGAIPSDTITIRYRTTNGASGDAPVDSVSGSLQADLLTVVGTVSIEYLNSENAATGGSDRENLKSMKTSIPAFIRQQDAVLVLPDYDAAVLNVPGVVLSFADLVSSAFSSNVVAVHAFGQESVTFESESFSGAFSSQSSYQRYVQLSQIRANELQQFLSKRTPLTTHSVISRPGLAYVDLYMRGVRYDARLSGVDVHQAVTDAVVAVFEGSSGFRLPLSDLYRAVDEVEGVVDFVLDRAVFEHQIKPRAVGIIEFNGQPADGNYVEIDDGSQVIRFEFDMNGDGAAGLNERVLGGATLRDTILNFVDTVNGRLNVTLRPDFTISPVRVSVEHKQGGSQFNIPMTKLGANITVTGLDNGTDTVETVIEDYRRDQNPSQDKWPVGSYAPGAPFTAGVWSDGGQLPYRALEDIEIKSVRESRRFYDDTFLYNNEILYNSGLDTESDIQAMVLRRLIFDLVPVGR